MSKGFVHLKVHSDYSLSEGASKIPDLASRAKELHLPAMAITDKDNLFGAMDFSGKLSPYGIQPIIGCHLHADLGEGNKVSFSLYAQSEVGYRNLCAILRDAHDPIVNEDGSFMEKPFPYIDFSILEERSQDLIMLSGGGKDGFLPSLVKKSLKDGREAYEWMLGLFGDRFYVEISRNGLPTEEEAELEDRLISLAYGEDVEEVICQDGVARNTAPLVATTEVYYATPSRHQAWALLNAISNKRTVTMDGNDYVNIDETPHHLRSVEEMEGLFQDLPEALDNTQQIAHRCSFMVRGRKPMLPPFACKDGRTEAEELNHQSWEGLESRLRGLFDHLPDDEKAEKLKVYHDRMEYELKVISNMGFPGYFLIVSDFIKWAKSQDIPVGPGRGSGAGSIVAWALTITDLDPLEFGLLFERFLNPARVSMPDFDIDFCQDRRSEVIQYVRQKYGNDRVSMIATFSAFKAAGALKDVGRAIIHNQLGVFGHSEINDLTKLIPKKLQEDESIVIDDDDDSLLSETYRGAPEFREAIDNSPKLHLLFEQGKIIEGLNKSSGSHAAGVIIGDRPLQEWVPVTWDHKMAMPVCSFSMKGAEASGLVKFDFLGLTNLSICHLAVRYIKMTTGRDIDLATIGRADERVMRAFQEGKTTGVFQFESPFMRKTLRQVCPTRFEDLVAINALGRPGPMDNIPSFAARKNGLENFSYPQPEEKTKPFLEETYGFMVYQEQVMQVAQACAGYSLGGADLLRRAMGKKIKEEMDKQRDIFVHGYPGDPNDESNPPVPGAVALGMDEKTASELFDDIAKFAGYGFNKSHAAAYSWIAYQTMWLKQYYPVEFFSALMSYNIENPEKLALIREDMDEMGVRLLSPDINASFSRFVPEEVEDGGYNGYAVRFGFSAVKSISGELQQLVEEREKVGKFSSLEDFYSRCGKSFNKTKLERLAEVGAFEQLSDSRHQAANALVWLATRKDKKTDERQMDFLSGIVANIVIPKQVLDVEEWKDVQAREYNAVGFYFAQHPITKYQKRLHAGGVSRRKSYQTYLIKKKEQDGTIALRNKKICVMVDDVFHLVSKKKTAYLNVRVSESNDSYYLCIFNSDDLSLQDAKEILEGAKVCRKPVVMTVNMTLRNRGNEDDISIVANQIVELETFLESHRGNIVISLNGKKVFLTEEEKSKLASFPESERPKVYYEATKRKLQQVAEFLKGCRNDQDEKSSLMVIRTPYEEMQLEGRYLMTSTVENVLKTMDGIDSIQEEFSKPSSTSQASTQPSI